MIVLHVYTVPAKGILFIHDSRCGGAVQIFGSKSVFVFAGQPLPISGYVVLYFVLYCYGKLNNIVNYNLIIIPTTSISK